MYHRPVLLTESIEGLSLKQGGIYVDATFGGGGHSRAILAQLENGRLIAFDQDEEALANLPEDDRICLVNSNFRYLIHYLRYLDAIPVDGILCDLGVSSHQIDSPERGFSTRFDGELDLRMNRNKALTAKTVVNTFPEEKLCDILHFFGEIDNARKSASAIVSARSKTQIHSTSDLRSALRNCMPRGKENQYLAQVFQALRIEVNQELEALREFLEQSEKVLRPGGRLVMIAYHSLEDRLVKNFMRNGNMEGKAEKDFYGNLRTPFRQITRKPMTAGEAELAENPRSRSAKMRIAEKI
jgi:16S rRNA (cytosine1402-N4)-methyltransferase